MYEIGTQLLPVVSCTLSLPNKSVLPVTKDTHFGACLRERINIISLTECSSGISNKNDKFEK